MMMSMTWVLFTSSGVGVPHARHNGSVNILYADWHAAPKKIANQADPYPELGGTSWKKVQWSGIPNLN